MATQPPVLAVSFGPLYDDDDRGGLSPEAVEGLVNADIDAFDRYFQGELKNEPMSPAERAIIKTYLYYKTMV
jgi:hypothetical protein